MKVRYLKNIKKFNPSVLTIGVFDGVHRGHLRILNKTKEIADRYMLTSSVLTFSPHPLKILKSKITIPLIMNLEHRLKIMKEIGVDQVVIARFTRNFARKKPEFFIKNILLEKLNAKWIVVGSNYRFGKDGSGNKRLFKKFSKKYGFKVIFIKPIKIGRSRISSSQIRKLVSSGQLTKAARYLGRYYSVFGEVIQGSCRGRLLGFATANLLASPELLLKNGVYAGWVQVENKKRQAMINVGFRPTFATKKKIVEAHIFNFHENIYGKKIEVFFVKRLRGERKFRDKDRLIQQLKEDSQRAKEILKKLNKL
jgi:riboflavin kinase/FMN adenylyltransferase